MTQIKSPPQTEKAEPHDPYKMRTLEQILMVFDGGEFLNALLDGHQRLMHDLLEHNEKYGSKGCQGEMTLTLSYALASSGDTGMAAKLSFKAPKKPASVSSAYINEKGELTLFNPMMRRMQHPVRDVHSTNYDPETGEVRDV